MTSESTPESGTTSYDHDNDANVTSKTDARGVTVNYHYDALNRLTAKTYSDGTASACFEYDAPAFGPNMSGNLSEEWTQTGPCASTGAPSSALTAKFSQGYDPMGRSIGDQQCIAGSCNNGKSPYLLLYGYDLAGHRTSLRDPSGTIFTSGYDGAGRLSSVTNASSQATLFSATSFGPLGLLNSTLGNGLAESRSYTNRGWVQSYSVVNKKNQPVEPAPSGIVDYARNDGSGGNALPQNGTLDVGGWAESAAGCPLEKVEIDLDSQVVGLANVNGSRPDVQQALGGGSQFANCGFTFSGSIGNAAPGTHTVNVYGYDFNGNRGLISNQWPITVSAQAAPFGNVDWVEGVQSGSATVVSGGLITMQGWAVDSQQKSPIGAVAVWVDGNPIGFATLGIQRPDVAAAYNNQGYLNSGWAFTGTIGDLSPGTHRIGANFYDTGGNMVSPASVYTVTVTADASSVAGDVNSVNGTLSSPTAVLGSAFTVVGWAAEPNYAPCASITRVEVWLDNKLIGTAQTGIARQDVASGYNNQNCLDSGWSYSGTLAGVDPGPHLLFARAYDHNGGSTTLQSTPLVVVSGQIPPGSVTSSLPTQYAWSLGYGPNGEVAYSYDSVNGNWAYLYDNLDRLSAAGSSTQGLQWTYDNFGNKWEQTVTAGSGFGSQQSFGTASNRSDQACYDQAGNQLESWGCSPTVQQFAYDAEERLSAANFGNVVYIYDAEGRRVAKQSGGVTTNVYIYDNQGQDIAELDGSGTVLRREIYVDGRHLATYDDANGGGLDYVLSDWLGTERARSDGSGALCQTTTSQPYGDGAMTSGTCSPSNRFFAGMERDAESGLDHTLFRQYASSVGRWTSPDPYDGSYDLNNPQSFNRYSYVGNMPLSYTDPSGQDTTQCGPYSICVSVGAPGGSGGGGGGILSIFIDAYDIISSFFGHSAPHFKGVVGSPRPSTPQHTCVQPSLPVRATAGVLSKLSALTGKGFSFGYSASGQYAAGAGLQGGGGQAIVTSSDGSSGIETFKNGGVTGGFGGSVSITLDFGISNYGALSGYGGASTGASVGYFDGLGGSASYFSGQAGSQGVISLGAGAGGEVRGGASYGVSKSKVVPTC